MPEPTTPPDLEAIRKRVADGGCICDELRAVVCAAHRQRQQEVLREPVGAPTYEELAKGHAEMLDQVEEWRREMKAIGAELAEAQRRLDLAQPVLDTSVAYRDAQRRDVIDRPITKEEMFRRLEEFRPIREALFAAVDTYKTQESTDGS